MVKLYFFVLCRIPLNSKTDYTTPTTNLTEPNNDQNQAITNIFSI